MIVVKAIFDENGTASPEENPNTKFGSHFDGDKYYFFESDQEREDFFKTLN